MKKLSLLLISIGFSCSENEDPIQIIQEENKELIKTELLGQWNTFQFESTIGVYVNGGWGQNFHEKINYTKNDLTFLTRGMYYSGYIDGEYKVVKDTIFFKEKNAAVNREYFKTYKIKKEGQDSIMELRSVSLFANGTIDTKMYDSVKIIDKYFYKKIK